MKRQLVLITLAASLGLLSLPASADTLGDVKARGFLQCGLGESIPGFSRLESDNQWTGFNVDFCRALASAIFNDPQAVRFTPTTAADSWRTLTSGAVDVLSRNSTWTMQNELSEAVRFVTPTYYDGQGLMVRKDSRIESARELSGLAVCVEKGTAAELNVADYFAANRLDYMPMAFDSRVEALKAFQDGGCKAYTANASGLAGDRAGFAEPADYTILPDLIGKAPLGPVIRLNDDRWFTINRWVVFALINAEELGVTQSNVDEMLGSDNPEIKRLLGVEEDLGAPIGLGREWAYQVIKSVGNYGEVFNRNIGPQTLLALSRGLNALSRDGGILYAPPIR